MSIRFGWTRPQAGQQTTADELVQDATSASPDIGAHPAPPVNQTGAANMQGQNDTSTSDSGSKGGDAPIAPHPGTEAIAPTPPASPSPSAMQAVWDVHERV